MAILAQAVIFFFYGVTAAFALSMSTALYYAISPSIKAFFKDLFSTENGYVILPSNI